MMMKDEAIWEIRKIRHKISEEHEHDPQKLVDYYIEFQKQCSSLAQFEEQQKETAQTP